MNFYEISACICSGLVLIGILLYIYKLYFWSFAHKPQKILPKVEQNKKYAILVPARDESKVIADLLTSISKQTYNKENLHTYVVVSDPEDKTIDICKDFENTTCYCLTEKSTCKGQTLKGILKFLKSKDEHFDGYFIIDADNVLKVDFIEKMHDAMNDGNDIVLGCRLNKSPSRDWVNCGSVLTWAFLNTLNNKCRSAKGQNILVQGSPLLVSKTIIEDFWGGEWPLCSLTEDLELGYICSIEGFKSYYCESACAYDEQPHTYKQSSKQRLRWIKGHSQVNSQFRWKCLKSNCKNLKGIFKYDALFSLVGPITIVFSALVFVIYSGIATIILAALKNPLWIQTLIGFGTTVLLSYFVLCFWTLLALWADKDKLSLSKYDKFSAFFTVPVFFLSYLPIYIKSFIIQNVKWTKIEHSQRKKA